MRASTHLYFGPGANCIEGARGRNVSNEKDVTIAKTSHDRHSNQDRNEEEMEVRSLGNKKGNRSGYKTLKVNTKIEDEA